MIGKEGRHLISIPVRGIEIPHFRYGNNDDGGVGAGDGKAGDKVDEGSDQGPGGTNPGSHILEVEVSLDELGIPIES